MKTPEFGDIIVTNNGVRWVCADNKTIAEKVGVDPDSIFPEYPIKAYPSDLRGAFNFIIAWKSVDSIEESWEFQIKEVIPSRPRDHADLIKAWAQVL